MAVKNLTAGASHCRIGFLRRHPLASFPHRIFAFGPVPGVALCLKIGLGSVRQKDLPRLLKIGAGLVEGRGGAAPVTCRKLLKCLRGATPAGIASDFNEMEGSVRIKSVYHAVMKKTL
jgi:hypothetical protein